MKKLLLCLTGSSIIAYTDVRIIECVAMLLLLWAGYELRKEVE